MSKLYNTAIYVQKSTQKVIFRLQEQPINKYMWEKAKALQFEKLAKEKFIDKWDIEIRDYGTNQPE